MLRWLAPAAAYQRRRDHGEKPASEKQRKRSKHGAASKRKTAAWQCQRYRWCIIMAGNVSVAWHRHRSIRMAYRA